MLLFSATNEETPYEKLLHYLQKWERKLVRIIYCFNKLNIMKQGGLINEHMNKSSRNNDKDNQVSGNKREHMKSFFLV